MAKNKFTKALTGVVCGALSLTFLPLAGCGGSRDSITIMTEELSGLFNPFYATSGTDMDVVGMTQIGMLSTDKDGLPVVGEDLPTVAKAFKQEPVTTASGAVETVYTFVLKNGLKFSDGVPLTMNDVLFSMYEYLDPVYTGSSTMYSIKIKGLTQYRTQTDYSGETGSTESQISQQASALASLRLNELVEVYEDNGLITGSQNAYSMTEEQMKEAIGNWAVTDGYKNAVASTAKQANLGEDDYRKMLQEDYELTLETFKKELESDYAAAKESYDLNTMPYSEWKDKLENDVFKFFLYEGYITPKYEDNKGRPNREKIISFENESIVNTFDTQEKAINRVYGDNVKSEFNKILTAWGTAGTLRTQYEAAAKEVILYNNMKNDGSLLYPNIEGIVSLGHPVKQSDGTTVQPSVDKVTIDGVDYKVAKSYNPDGTPANADEYAVLQITVDGTDPKAIYNFGFTVSPVHYYTADSENPNGRTVDIANNKFGVEYASASFQTKTIQSREHVEIPLGAGAYKASNRDHEDNPSGADFWSSGFVYFKANEHFMFDVKTQYINYQVISSANALDQLENGDIDFVTPQFTKTNSTRLKAMEKKGFTQLDTWQLGYGYIGINAGKVPDVNIRRAIMAAMQTSLALTYYEPGTCKNIDWPMSNVSWAYPTMENGSSKPNGHPYTQWTTKQAAIDKITELMKKVEDAGGNPTPTVKFTIAGASITEHPTYAVFKQAMEILNELGWNVDIKADSQALTKLSTGSLEVWAAAWGSTIDPDMYQVYHKNSGATSVYAWGYREIKANPTLYSYEYSIIAGTPEDGGKNLSDLIDDGREILDQNERKKIYEEAMGRVLDLAVELPVYQRKTLYAYNSDRIGGINKDINPYTSPLERIWELELL